jgi:ribonucleoside-diphosphate reductase alpha chain
MDKEKKVGDVLRAERHRVQYRDDDKVYILVTFNEEDQPVEVFANFSFTHDHQTFYTHSAWEAITRLTSKCLMTLGLEETIQQLERSSLNKRDAPGILASVLKQYSSVQ